MRINTITFIGFIVIGLGGFAFTATAEEPAEASSACDIEVKVTGMSCPVGCSPKVQKALETQDGVSTATVNFEKGMATVAATGPVCDASQDAALVTALKKAGFDGKVVKRTAKAAAK
jgi:copper chaperone CopZ